MTSTPDELNRGLEDLWSDALKLHANQRIWIRSKTRRRIFDLLGKGKVKELVGYKGPTGMLDRMTGFRPNSREIRKIYGELVNTRSGLLSVVPELNENAQLTYETPGGGTRTEDVDNLVRDPHSNEARVFAWLWEESVNGGNRAEYSEIFNPIDADEVQRAKKILKIKESADSILGDAENLDIGKLGTVTPGTPPTVNNAVNPPVTTPGTPPALSGEEGRLGELQRRQMMAEYNALVQSATPGGNAQPSNEQAAKYSDDIRKLENKKRKVHQDVSTLNRYLRDLDPRATALSPADIAQDADTLTTSFPAINFTINGETKPLGEWVNDDELKASVEDLGLRFRARGNDLPNASAMLDALLRKRFDASLAGASEEDSKAFYRDIKRMLTTEGAGSSSSAGASNESVASTIDVEKGTLSSIGSKIGSAVNTTRSGLGKVGGFILDNFRS